MRYPIRLFLGSDEVEFSTPPAILFNYSETDMTNPTAIKNSYTKTITIEGTAQNNKIFGQIYNLERIQNYGGTVMGTSFNPLVKTEFTLYYNNSIYESGYFKLDEIRRNNNNTEYDITLYGGLGDFFYNLSFREDGIPMELSDLTLEWEKENSPIEFTINKETVAEAWNYIWQPSSKWNTINFAPCYNGIPENGFSADKVLINNSGITDYQPTINQKDYSMGIISEELTEWEAFDLRSYLQRPVVKVSQILDAICDPENNGGFTVNLDEKFFDVNNPYYADSWMTLPLLTELDVPETVSTPLAVSAITQESNTVYNVWKQMGNASNVSLRVGLKFTPTDGYTGQFVYLNLDYRANGGITLNNTYVKEYAVESDIWVQMIGYNETGQISTASNIYQIQSPRSTSFFFYENSNEWAIERFNMYEPFTNATECKNVWGRFAKKNGEYIFCDFDGNEKYLDFKFPADSQFTELKLKIAVYDREHRRWTFNGGYADSQASGDVKTWSTFQVSDYTWHDLNYIQSRYSVEGNIEFVPRGATGTTTSFEGFFTGRHYTKKDLLTLGITPANFLLSYAKMFGLYFVKDVESKTISILTRHNFYQRDNIVNINDLVDKGSDIKIIPSTPKYQFYDFGLEQIDSEVGSAYKKTYSNDYGTATVNTGYQFEKEHKSVLNGNCFKGAVDVLEKDKYYLIPIFGSSAAATNNGPTYVNNGFRYWYYLSGNNTDEYSKDTKNMSGETLNPDGLRFYDLFPKPQFHTEQNKASDGRCVLLFCDLKNYDIAGKGYHLTDDTQQMYTMNNQSPCWIMTRGTTDKRGVQIALNVDFIPMFNRCLYQNGVISFSFDLGKPLATYIPNIYVNDWQSIYHRGWKSYISDLYSVDSRILKCRCLLRERPNPEWLRRFYWFDNSYWRLNEIKDWNISSFETTEMEFVKVQDIENYDNIEFSIYPQFKWELDAEYLRTENDTPIYSIGSGATTVTGYILCSDGGGITFAGENPYVNVLYEDGQRTEYLAADIVSPISASGSLRVPITLTIPANDRTVSRTLTFDFEDAEDRFHEMKIIQDARN